MRDFHITYFHGPFYDYIDREEVVSDIAAAGFTLVPIGFDTEKNRSALKVFSKYGVSAIVSDPRIRAVYAADDIAGADAAVREVAADYSGFDNLIGWDIVDEPSANKFPVLAAIVNAFRKYTPGLETTINLFPNHAYPEALGTPDYMSYLECFVNTVRPHHLSYDHYHFLGRKKRAELKEQCVDERERLIREAAEKPRDRDGFFDNIEDVRRVALKYGLDAMLIVLLTEHGPYRNLTYSELLWEVNMCLAYGMKRISYFTYWLPPYNDHWQWDNAMCDTVGNKMPHWFDVQKINALINPVGRRLFGRTSTGVFRIENGKAEIPGGGISEVGTAGSLVIGTFDDGSLYIVNADYREPVSFSVKSYGTPTYLKGECFAPAEGRDFALAAGDGILLK